MSRRKAPLQTPSLLRYACAQEKAKHPSEPDGPVLHPQLIGRQALGSLLAFLLSNIIAKVLSYILNRKKTFKADNNVASSLAIYIVMVVLLIIVETIIGTPLQNWIYALLGGTYEGQSLTTATVSDQVLYQICGTLSPMLYGIGDCVIVFLMDKYVIMKRSEGLKE